MIEQAGPPSKQIQATKQVQEFLRDGDDVIIIGVFSGENDKTYHLYQEAGKECFKILMKYVLLEFCLGLLAWRGHLFQLLVQKGRLERRRSRRKGDLLVLKKISSHQILSL